MSQYRNVCQYDLASHVFALANKAYHAMIHEQKNQRFVISGESGAGKTVTANLVSSNIKLLKNAIKTQMFNCFIYMKITEMSVKYILGSTFKLKAHNLLIENMELM